MIIKNKYKKLVENTVKDFKGSSAELIIDIVMGKNNFCRCNDRLWNRGNEKVYIRIGSQFN